MPAGIFAIGMREGGIAGKLSLAIPTHLVGLAVGQNCTQ